MFSFFDDIHYLCFFMEFWTFIIFIMFQFFCNFISEKKFHEILIDLLNDIWKIYIIYIIHQYKFNEILSFEYFFYVIFKFNFVFNFIQKLFIKFQHILCFMIFKFIFNGTSLHIAVDNYDTNIINLLLSHKNIDVNAKNKILFFFILK